MKVIYDKSYKVFFGENVLNHLAQTITHWLQNYGFWALILIAAGPIHQHPTVAIAALAKVPLMTIFISMFVGRLFKYGVYTWLSTHAKKGLQRFFKE